MDQAAERLPPPVQRVTAPQARNGSNSITPLLARTPPLDPRAAAHASPRAHLRRFPSFGKDHIEAQPYTYARDCFNKFGWLRLDEDWG